MRPIPTAGARTVDHLHDIMLLRATLDGEKIIEVAHRVERTPSMEDGKPGLELQFH